MKIGKKLSALPMVTGVALQNEAPPPMTVAIRNTRLFRLNALKSRFSLNGSPQRRTKRCTL